MKKALILGITGQDGSYLAELLLEKGYEVHGFARRTATGNTKNIDHILEQITLHRGDLFDTLSLQKTIQEVAPDEIYNEADQDHAGWSFNIVEYQYRVTGAVVGTILEIIRSTNSKIKYFQPLTSNMFGEAEENPQTENTPFHPRNPYAAAKVFANTLVKFYREAYDMFAATAIFYNHESPRRPEEYVTRKITRGAAKISLGLQKTLELGDLSATIDWGYSKEYMEAAWNIMQQEKPDDFIIATGEAHTVQEFVDEAFKAVNLDARQYVTINPKFLRPTKNSLLVGNISKAKTTFGFDPKVRFKELIKLMIDADLANLRATIR